MKASWQARVGPIWGLSIWTAVAAALVLVGGVLAGCCSDQATSPATAEPASTNPAPVEAQENFRIEQPVVRNASSDTVWVSFENGQTNYQLAPGEEVASNVGPYSASNGKTSFRVTRDGGAVMLQGYWDVTKTLELYSRDPSGSLSWELNKGSADATETPTEQGEVGGREISAQRLFANEQVVVTLLGDNWK